MKKFINKIKKTCKDFMTGKSGFSLVELIVVIAIMAIMAAVLAPALLGYVEKSRMQKDDSAMDEVVNSVQLAIADQEVYDDLLPYAVKGNFSCYADNDTSTNIETNKIFTKGSEYWLYNDEARKLDETPYIGAGSMRGVTITLRPDGSGEYVLKSGIVNQMGAATTKKGDLGGAILEDCEYLYNRLRSTVGDTIKATSQTYRNSDYTIFISMGTTGGNQADAQDAIKVYGQFNGTNLATVVNYTGGGAGGGETPDVDQPGGGGTPIELPAKGKTLEQYTWEEVRDIIAAGKAGEYGFVVGGTKTFSINGMTKTATIIGLNHDGNNTATFMIVSSGGIGEHVMNTNRTNAGGWEASEMRDWLNGNIYNSMSNKDYIKTVTKMTNNIGYKGNSVTGTQDNVFLLSPKEAGVEWQMADSNYWDWPDYVGMNALNSEGSTYTWFATNTVGDYFWLRSPNSDYDDDFFNYCYGDLSDIFADDESTVYPAFVIG